ncbi:tyrosine-type recombinase/integrase [Amycolatopsis sp. NPDC059657]|uniref:tyrosine-type recombinase/integrase n=1 Tax=Amycolatopsis sp. NPDC059657 TaxID=3346899 RepID=UPI00366C1742
MTGPIFASSTGGLRDPSYVLRVIREVCGGDELLWATEHTMRKTTATALDDKGVNTRLVADQLGHSRVSMTRDVYMARKSVSREAADALEDLRITSPTPKTGINPGR